MANIHFIVKGANEDAIDLVLIQTFLLYYVNSCNSYANFLAGKGKKRKDVFIKTRSTSASSSLEGLGTKLLTVKWSIVKVFKIFLTSRKIK